MLPFWDQGFRMETILLQTRLDGGWELTVLWRISEYVVFVAFVENYSSEFNKVLWRSCIVFCAKLKEVNPIGTMIHTIFITWPCSSKITSSLGLLIKTCTSHIIVRIFYYYYYCYYYYLTLVPMSNARSALSILWFFSVLRETTPSCMAASWSKYNT